MKKIRFMDTSFRDGFQSCFGARVLTKDFLPAVEASREAGIQHFEAGGGARFQSLFFYCNESAFEMMDQIRAAAGPDADLQTLARGINVVALSQQPKDMIDLHAKLFKKHGITTIRNFDALNDIRNLEYSGERIKAHGLHHQIVITVMDLPPGCKGAHGTDFYIAKLQEILKSDIPFDSIAFKDATGTANPHKVFETVQAARKAVPENTTLWFHTHDTAGLGIAQNLAAINAGIDGIDLAQSPCSGGTCQPDILSMIHALKGTEYTLDMDYKKILVASEVFEECMQDYFMPPEALATSAVITLSPMPGGALTANTMMMRDTNTLHLYPKVIKEMSEVVRLGGFATSVTPVSQFYFQQAYANVTQGPWKKITEGYGNMILGYFGKTPSAPDAKLVKLAKEQLKKPEFTADPLSILEPGIEKAKAILEQNGLESSEENQFIIASCEDRGLQFLKGEGRVQIRKKSTESALTITTKTPSAAQDVKNYNIRVDGQTYQVQVSEGDLSTLPVVVAPPTNQAPTVGGAVQTINAPLPGNVLRIEVSVGQTVQAGQVLLILEAMKMETEIKATAGGTVVELKVRVGDALQTGDTLLTIGA